MARIAGVDLPRRKHIGIALTYIYGIGKTRSRQILEEAGISVDKRAKDLDDQEITTQRQLSEQTGISLGQVNYVVKSLINKGLIKIGNFRKSERKIGYG